jgi:hypothetical protein
VDVERIERAEPIADRRAPSTEHRAPSTAFLLRTGPGDEAFARGVRREVARAVVEAGFGLLELSAERMTLEDIFVRLVTEEQHW